HPGPRNVKHPVPQHGPRKRHELPHSGTGIPVPFRTGSRSIVSTLAATIVGGRFSVVLTQTAPATAERRGQAPLAIGHRGASAHRPEHTLMSYEAAIAMGNVLAAYLGLLTTEVEDACRAVVAFGRGDHTGVVDLLYPIRHRVNEFGGSHAQRDAVQRTLLESALRAGAWDVARVLVSERISVRPRSPYNWLKQAALADMLGNRAASAAARERADGLARAVL
ncbi:hypothetical protein ACFOY2_08860, partial [Nonomuraea purpurea]